MVSLTKAPARRGKAALTLSARMMALDPAQDLNPWILQGTKEAARQVLRSHC